MSNMALLLPINGFAGRLPKVNASMSRIVVTTVTCLSLIACTGETKGFNYPKDGERATLESITGVWEDQLNRSDGSLDLSYVVIRDDGTHINADYHGTPLSNGQVNCYDILESTINQVATASVVVAGAFYIGDGNNQYKIYTHKDSMAYYKINLSIGVSTFDSEYNRLANTEAEMNFTPICEG